VLPSAVLLTRTNVFTVKRVTIITHQLRVERSDFNVGNQQFRDVSLPSVHVKTRHPITIAARVNTTRLRSVRRRVRLNGMQFCLTRDNCLLTYCPTLWSRNSMVTSRQTDIDTLSLSPEMKAALNTCQKMNWIIMITTIISESFNVARIRSVLTKSTKAKSICG